MEFKAYIHAMLIKGIVSELTFFASYRRNLCSSVLLNYFNMGFWGMNLNEKILLACCL